MVDCEGGYTNVMTIKIRITGCHGSMQLGSLTPPPQTHALPHAGSLHAYIHTFTLNTKKVMVDL